MPMPTAFGGYVEKPARVSSTCLVTVSGNRYSAPCEFDGQLVSARLYPGRVNVVACDTVVAIHERIAKCGQVRYDWKHYISLVQRKPGALRNGAPFATSRTARAVRWRRAAPSRQWMHAHRNKRGCPLFTPQPQRPVAQPLHAIAELFAKAVKTVRWRPAARLARATRVYSL